MVGDVWVGNVFGHFCPAAIEVKIVDVVGAWKLLVQPTELVVFFFFGAGFLQHIVCDVYWSIWRGVVWRFHVRCRNYFCLCCWQHVVVWCCRFILSFVHGIICIHRVLFFLFLLLWALLEIALNRFELVCCGPWSYERIGGRFKIGNENMLCVWYVYTFIYTFI